MDDIVEHRLRLTNLESGTEYHYRVCSSDPNDNPTTCSDDFSFTTLAAADLAPPQILTGPIATAITEHSATLRLSSDEVGTLSAVYGTRPDLSDGRRIDSATPTLDHTAVLTNLEPGTEYHYQVLLTDVSGNTSTGKEGSFNTRAAPDEDPPLILTGPVAVSISDQGVQIEFTTDEDAELSIEFASGEDVPLLVQRAERVRRHAIALTNLESDTRYSYRIILSDAAGNTVTKPDQSFKTLAAPDRSAPVITSGPVVTTRLHDQVVVEWNTDEAGDTEVRFGTTPDYGGIVSSMDDVLSHRVRLTNLIPETGYHYTVCSTDASGNGPACSGDLSFATLSTPDTESPTITAAPVVRNRTDASADIAWSTNELADSFVEYGPDPNYGLSTGSAEHRLQHEVRLTNLEPNTTYYYRIASTDPAGNGPTHNEDGLSFFTRSTPDLLPPVIVADPVVRARTEYSATVQWLTDEPADGHLRYGTGGRLDTEIVTAEDVTTHVLNLTNLLPDTEYRYQVSSTDASENGPTLSDTKTFRTRAVPDTEAPQLLNGPIAVNITSTAATIEWTTNEPAHSVVDLGTDTAYRLDHIERGDLVEFHSVSIANLTPGTTYHYKIASADISNNLLSTEPSGASAHSRDHTFKTLLNPDEDPPVFLEGPVVFAQDQAAKAEWRTDEPARYELILATDPALSSEEREIIQNNEYRERHSVDLTRLERGTAYYYQLTAWDQSGNQAVAGTASTIRNKRVGKLAQPPGGAGSFVTRPEPDTQLPVLISPPSLAAKTTTSLAIEWETDERADSFVEFGTDGKLDNIVGSASDVTQHRVILTNLEPGARFEYIINSTDPSGNGATKSTVQMATTALEVDLIPPAITRAPTLVYKTDRTATIEWSTDELSTSEVEYGIDGLELVRVDANTTREHRITLTNLEPATEYVYRIGSSDPSGNGPTQVTDLVFVTSAEPDFAPPQIVTGPEVTNITHSKATIKWTTDELADSFVDYGLSENELYEVAGAAVDVLEHILTLTNLEPATTYYFAAGSIDRANNGPVLSDVFSFTTAATRDLTPPDMPALLYGEPGSEAARVRWSPSLAEDVAGYNLYRRTGGGTHFELVASMVRDTTYLDKGLINGVPFVYQLAAVDNASPPNESVPTTPITLSPGPENVPGAPTALSVEASDENTLLTIGNAVPNPERSELNYTFQVSTSSQFSDLVARGGRVSESQESSTEWSFSRKLESKREYWWRVRANDGLFDGPWMEPHSFLPSEIPSRSKFNKTLTADFDLDGFVGFIDFFLFADQFGREVATENDHFDLDQDRKIGFSDFFILTDHFTGSSDTDLNDENETQNQNDDTDPDNENETQNQNDDIGPGDGSLDDEALAARTPTSKWEPPGGAIPPSVDRRPRKNRLTKPVAKTERQEIIKSDIYLLEVERQSAKIAVEVACDTDLDGYGIVLRHGASVVADFGRGISMDGDAVLQGILLAEAERTWFGAYAVQDKGEDRYSRTLEFELEFPEDAIGSEVVVEALWTIDREGRVSRMSEVGTVKLVPQHYRLDAPYPNPFNPVVNLRYTLPEETQVRIEIFNVLGQRVRRIVDEVQKPGVYNAQWHGRHDSEGTAASGIYFIRLNAGEFLSTRKVLLLK